jgi:nucleoside 2-deoxyribosyltransferase
MTTKKFFLSYAAQDHSFAIKLRDTMGKLGVEFLDPTEDITPGVDFEQAITRGIEEADAVLLVVPEAGSKGANFAFFEAGAAHALGKRVVGVVPEQKTRRELPAEVLDFAVMETPRQSIEILAQTLVRALDPV